MAGIGFELGKILAKPGYVNLVRAYGYAALIGSGPWVFSILSLAMLGTLLRGMTSREELDLFFLAVTYIYGFSLIITGPAQMILTRYAADRHFSNERHRIFPAIVTLLAFSSFLSSLVGLLVFCSWFPRLCSFNWQGRISSFWSRGFGSPAFI